MLVFELRGGGPVSAPRTPAQRGRANRNKGHQAERDICKWLRAHGFSGAERAVKTGFRAADRTVADPGDITGTPCIVWSVKDVEREHMKQWLAELDAMLAGHPYPEALGLLVHKRRGHADPGSWWVWISAPDLAALLGAPAFDGSQWFRTTLAELVPLLRSNGHGDAPAPYSCGVCAQVITQTVSESYWGLCSTCFAAKTPEAS